MNKFGDVFKVDWRGEVCVLKVLGDILVLDVVCGGMCVGVMFMIVGMVVEIKFLLSTIEIDYDGVEDRFSFDFIDMSLVMMFKVVMYILMVLDEVWCCEDECVKVIDLI